MANGAGERIFRNLGAVVCAGFTLCAGMAVAQAQVSISVGSGAVASPGDVASVCISLDGDGMEVAATENEIHWDTSCITPVAEGCRANPEHGKSLFARINDEAGLPEPFLKAIVISFADSDPIADGELYCCNFMVDLEEEGACCELRIEEPLVSSPEAEALTTLAGPPGMLCLDSSATPNTPIVPDTRTPTWTPSPQFATETPTATVVETETTPPPAPSQATRTATFAIQTSTPLTRSGDEDDGCQIAAPRRSGGLPLLLVPLLLLWRCRTARRATAGR